MKKVKMEGMRCDTNVLLFHSICTEKNGGRQERKTDREMGVRINALEVK